MERFCYNVLSLIVKTRSHARDIARKLDTNHTKVIRALKVLEELNIVDFEIVGKNKVYYVKNSFEAKEYLLILEHIKLLNVIDRYPLFRSIVSQLKNVNVDFILLFGSYAKMSAKSSSDIDIFVQTKDLVKKEDIENINYKLSVKIGDFDESTFLGKEILDDYVVVKGVEDFHERIYQKINIRRKN